MAAQQLASITVADTDRVMIRRVDKRSFIGIAGVGSGTQTSPAAGGLTVDHVLFGSGDRLPLHHDAVGTSCGTDHLRRGHGYKGGGNAGGLMGTAQVAAAVDATHRIGVGAADLCRGVGVAGVFGHSEPTPTAAAAFAVDLIFADPFYRDPLYLDAVADRSRALHFGGGQNRAGPGGGNAGRLMAADQFATAVQAAYRIIVGHAVFRRLIGITGGTGRSQSAPAAAAGFAVDLIAVSLGHGRPGNSDAVGDWLRTVKRRRRQICSERKRRQQGGEHHDAQKKRQSFLERLSCLHHTFSPFQKMLILEIHPYYSAWTSKFQ